MEMSCGGASAVRYEMKTGEQVRGRSHLKKAQGYTRACQRWLNEKPNASATDRDSAMNVIEDMQNALNGN